MYEPELPSPKWSLSDWLLVVFVVAVVVLGLSQIVHAHEWYTGQHNEKGWACCGGKDCAPLADGDVTPMKGGYYIHSRQIFVPNSRAQASPVDDGKFHACFYGSNGNPIWDNEPSDLPKCFFFPDRGY